MFKPQDLTDQDLVDHLCVAVEERDVQFVVLWSRLMKKREVIGGAFKRHSWKEISALSVATSRGHSKSNQITLEVLLHGCDEQFGSQAFQQETSNSRSWAQYAMKDWLTSGKAQAEDARKLLDMRSSDAEKWIKSKLAPPPFAENLTGFKPLPPRPEPVEIPAPEHKVALLCPFVPPPSEPSSVFALPPSKLPSRPSFAPRPILKHRRGAFPPPPPASARPPLPASPPPAPKPSPLKLDKNGKPIFKPSELCRLAIYRLPSSSSEADIFSILSSSHVPLSSVSIMLRANQSTIAFCTVSNKDDMNLLFQWGDSQDYFIERAQPSHPNFSDYYHVLFRNLPSKGQVDLENFKRFVRNVSRCGAFEFSMGHLPEGEGGGEIVGLARVGTLAGARECVEKLDGRCNGAVGDHLRVTFGIGRGPALIPRIEQEMEEELEEEDEVRKESKLKRGRQSDNSNEMIERPLNRTRFSPPSYSRWDVDTWRTNVSLVAPESIPQLPMPLPPLPETPTSFWSISPSDNPFLLPSLPNLPLLALPPLPSTEKSKCLGNVNGDEENGVSEWQQCSLAWIDKDK